VECWFVCFCSFGMLCMNLFSCHSPIGGLDNLLRALLVWLNACNYCNLYIDGLLNKCTILELLHHLHVQVLIVKWWIILVAPGCFNFLLASAWTSVLSNNGKCNLHKRQSFREQKHIGCTYPCFMLSLHVSWSCSIVHLYYLGSKLSFHIC